MDRTETVQEGVSVKLHGGEDLGRPLRIEQGADFAIRNLSPRDLPRLITPSIRRKGDCVSAFLIDEIKTARRAQISRGRRRLRYPGSLRGPVSYGTYLIAHRPRRLSQGQ